LELYGLEYEWPDYAYSLGLTNCSCSDNWKWLIYTCNNLNAADLIVCVREREREREKERENEWVVGDDGDGNDERVDVKKEG